MDGKVQQTDCCLLLLWLKLNKKSLWVNLKSWRENLFCWTCCFHHVCVYLHGPDSDRRTLRTRHLHKKSWYLLRQENPNIYHWQLTKSQRATSYSKIERIIQLSFSIQIALKTVVLLCCEKEYESLRRNLLHCTAPQEAPVRNGLCCKTTGFFSRQGLL